MPFRSKQQQKFMFATLPELAKEWAKKTDFSKIPKKVRKKKKKKDSNDCILEMANIFANQANK